MFLTVLEVNGLEGLRQTMERLQRARLLDVEKHLELIALRRLLGDLGHEQGRGAGSNLIMIEMWRV